MSDTGLYSNRYQQIRGYAELVDDVLLELDTDVRSADGKREALGELLVQLDDNECDDLSIRSVALLIKADDSIKMSDLSQAGKALLNGNMDEDTIAILHELARFLEKERSKAIAVMERRLR